MTDIADSYILALTTADAFFAKRLGSDAWDDATDANQTKALQMSTVAIDNLPLSGYKLLSTQARAFPRKYEATDSPNPWGNLLSEDPYGYIYESSEVPQFVLDSCCLEALALLEYYDDADAQNRRKLQEQNVTSVSLAGQISESYSSGGTVLRNGLKSQEAYDLLRPYIQLRGDIR